MSIIIKTKQQYIFLSLFLLVRFTKQSPFKFLIKNSNHTLDIHPNIAEISSLTTQNKQNYPQEKKKLDGSKGGGYINADNKSTLILARKRTSW